VNARAAVFGVFGGPAKRHIRGLLFMKMQLAYGRGSIAVELPDARTTVIEPTAEPPLADERAGVLAALDHPIGASNALR
jgi:hypothetical protein